MGFFKKRKKIDVEKLSPAALERRPTLKQQKDALTARISESTRTLAFGTLASCYALLLTKEDLAVQFAPVRAWLITAGAAAIAAVIIDSAQYLFGYINVEKALQRGDQLFPEDWSRRLRTSCFLAKQFFAYTGALIFLLAVISQLIPDP